MQFHGRKRTLGLSLVETTLVIGGLIGVGALAVQANKHSAMARDVKIEQENVLELSKNISDAYGITASYSTLNTANAANVAPMRMRTGNSTHPLIHRWQCNVTVGPVAIARPSDGFEIRYCDVPAEACLKLVNGVAPAATRVLIDGVSVMPRPGMLNHAQAVFPCSQPLNEIRFQFRASDGPQIAALAIAAPIPDPAAPPAPPCAGCPPTPPTPGVVPLTGASLVAPVAPSAPGGATNPVTTPQDNTVCPLTESRSVACAAGQTGSRTEARTRASCTGAWSAWSVTYDGCQTPVSRPIVIPPTPSGCPQCVANTTFVQNQNYNPSYPQTWTCAATPPAWATGCPAPCVAPARETRWVNRSDSNCPAGYTGTRTWEAEQDRTFSCPAPYGPYNTSSWMDTGSTRNMNTSGCAANCVVPSPSTETETETRTATQTLSCPAGQSGGIEQSRQEERTRSRTAYCPAATGPYAWGTWGAWGAWTATTSWTTTSNTCTASCGAAWQWNITSYNPGGCGSQGGGSGGEVCSGYGCNSNELCTAAVDGQKHWRGYAERWDSPPACDITEYTCEYVDTCGSACSASSQTQWVSASGSCPSGQTGSITWEKEQRRDYTCPAASWGSWSDTGNTRNVVNTCQSSGGSGNFSWQARDRVYGPGAGCHLGADTDRTYQDVQNGRLPFTVTGTYPNLYFDVRPDYLCTAQNVNEVLMVYSTCGGWQSGLEGYSGYRCEAGPGEFFWERTGSTNTTLVYQGPDRNAAPADAQPPYPGAGCSSGNLGTLSYTEGYSSTNDAGTWYVYRDRFEFECRQYNPDQF